MDELLNKIRRGECKEIILRKAIVIPAGTSFKTAAKMTTRNGEGHFSATIGLSKDTSGSIEYCVDPSAGEDSEQLINEWFLVI